MLREFSDGLVCRPQTPGHVINPAPPAGTSTGQTQGQAPHLDEGREGSFLDETGGSGGPWSPGCCVQRVGHDCRTERWGDSGILVGMGPGDSDAEATSHPGEAGLGSQGQVMGPILWDALP